MLESIQKVLYCKHSEALCKIPCSQLHSDNIVAAKKTTSPLSETVNSKEYGMGLLFFTFVSMCQELDPKYYAIPIIFFTFTYTHKNGISNSDFGDAVLDQVIYITSQCGFFLLLKKTRMQKCYTMMIVSL